MQIDWHGVTALEQLALITTTTMSSEGPLYRDPWAKREAWRKSPIFSNRAYLRNLFPGFGIGLGAFIAYVIVDETILKRRTPPSPPVSRADHH
ncbi:NADH-ubiquinone oxidoreductase B12 subunit family-domain-containing protein [Auriculariales sp. MPI-PUGE-AT-0066]|nr:NADH-ubiquinone oxidoreductase B12 subunit family-domain-containing protein [Auriculariales sp. MPI-PUGE-AT-0066]